jgi:hypothetical protein
MQLPHRYLLTPPCGKPFYAILKARADNVLVATTNRSGTWQVADADFIANLLMPEQDWNEWDIVKIDAPSD